MKKILTVVIVVVLAVFIVSLTKDAIIKFSVEKGVGLVTGLKLRIQGFNVGIVNQFVNIRKLTLYNPKGFKDKVMLSMPEIFVDYNLKAIMDGKVHLEEVRIDMEEFTVVKNEKGELNLDSLKVVQAEKEGENLEQKDKGKAPDIKIDYLKLKIGKVAYKDYSKGGKPDTREFNVNINEEFRNITNPYSLVSLIVVKALMNTSIANLTNFDLQGLQGTVSDTLKGAEKIAEEAVQKTQEAAKKTTEEAAKLVGETSKKAEEALQGTTKKIEDAAKGLTETIKLPFGSKKE